MIIPFCTLFYSLKWIFWHVLYHSYPAYSRKCQWLHLNTMQTSGTIFFHAHHTLPVQKQTTINNLPPPLGHQPCGQCRHLPSYQLYKEFQNPKSSTTITQIQCPCTRLYTGKSNMDNRAQKQHQQTKALFLKHRFKNLEKPIEGIKPPIRGSIHSMNICKN